MDKISNNSQYKYSVDSVFNNGITCKEDNSFNGLSICNTFYGKINTNTDLFYYRNHTRWYKLQIRRA